MSVKENLLAAADVVENGWCVGHLVKDGDKYCAVGALAKVITGIDNVGTIDAYSIVQESPEGKALAKVIARDYDTEYENEFDNGWYDDLIYDWNDTQEDKAVVIEAMRKAAEEV